ncbi:GDSL-type esterase/lipase family protein [Fulvivirgaceae bacterium BMA12]|uniref:GDSL-type esterase/lipase family protein n=1 Tax=Agaribacillus aureus TaxID=3051825 RepID=A0ABT8LEY4_9BACT|nr:GDSL-type esterase/lipase family protein [Fulvivirgaceae bacterium BMA12]
MKRLVLKSIIVLCALLVLGVIIIGFVVSSEFEKLESDDPLVWESTIKKFEKEDQRQKHPEEPVLFIGSSSIRFWRNLEKDMSPLPIIKRGFGGAKLRDIIHFANRIIIPYQPKAIVLFAGTNDISGRKNDKTPDEVFQDFQELWSIIAGKLPGTRLYYLPITPTSSRLDVWPRAMRANHLIHTFALETDLVEYVQCTPYFFDEQGKVNVHLFWWDGTHLNKEGYAIWKKAIKHRLLKELYFN